MSSSFGTALKLHIFGQSHGSAVGMTLEGFPQGFLLDTEELQAFLNRRAPGQSSLSTARREADEPEFISGLVDGCTCGAPITAILPNRDVRSEDYASLSKIPRPSHADYPARMKFGDAADLRGGGHYSGRLTAPLCVAGGLCLQFLRLQNIQIGAHIAQIGSVPDRRFDTLRPELPLNGLTLNESVWPEMCRQIEEAKALGDSVGGVVECAVTGLPAGLGEPVFGGLENRLSQILFGIPGLKAVAFGDGFDCAAMRGSEHNDPFFSDANGCVHTASNHAGGILGGMSTGMPLLFRVAVKPTPSIARQQESVSLADEPKSVPLEIQGRHDPCIVPRALPCVEAAAAIAILDAILEAKQWT